ncbi:MAG: homoserine kinase [Anaerolineales bacterium]
MLSVTVRAPATTANLGPGFDALGLALDLWNETRVTLTGQTISFRMLGEGEQNASVEDENLFLRAMRRVYEVCACPFPQGMRIRARNRIPWGAGLGSSAAAIVSGLLAANALLGQPLSDDELLYLAIEIEGHPDNIAPAFFGGLTVSLQEEDRVLVRSLPWRPFRVTVIVPEFSLPTQVSRRLLPQEVPLDRAARSIARAVLVTQAFAKGDLDLLRRAMQDELHQPYRLPSIPGAQEALRAAERLGAAVALSGAGPSLIAFSLPGMEDVAQPMQQAFAQAGIPSRCFDLRISAHGARRFVKLRDVFQASPS